MTELHLSRVRLRDDVAVAALAGSLLAEENGEAVVKAHRLLWSLFPSLLAEKVPELPQHKQRQRPCENFLWREEGGTHWRRRTFITLSARPPEDRVRLFDVETKPFAPVLAAGQRLRFRLRASPSVNERCPGAPRGKRKDPVSIALNGLPEKGKHQRDQVIQEVGHDWLTRQGVRAGFHLPDTRLLRVDGEDHRRLPRAGGPERTIRFSVLDFEGLLEVDDAAAFLQALSHGIGRARAFGCGLMLIRPA
jgi:CRISPR system Cascade subunit CasE